LLRYCCDCGGSSGVTLLSGAEHQRLIDGAKSLYFGLSLLESRLELLSGHLEVLDVSRSAV
jgi:hypothetical protein